MQVKVDPVNLIILVPNKEDSKYILWIQSQKQVDNEATVCVLRLARGSPSFGLSKFVSKPYINRLISNFGGACFLHIMFENNMYSRHTLGRNLQ